MDEAVGNLIGQSLFANNSSAVLEAVASLLKQHQGSKEKDVSLAAPMLVLTSLPGKDSLHGDVVLDTDNNSKRSESLQYQGNSQSEFPSLEQVHALAHASLVASTQLDIAQQLVQQANLEDRTSKEAEKKERKNNRRKTQPKKVSEPNDDVKIKKVSTSPVKLKTSEAPHPRALECSFDGCNKRFAWQTHLNYHELTHTNDRKHKCPHESCGKTFFTSQRLNVHLRTHTGEKPFKCSHSGCGKTFTTAGNLKNHERIHTGEQPFVCDFENCNRRFTEHSSLKKHKRTHTGEQPFECPVCGRRFSQSGSRQQHLNRHLVDEEIRASYVKNRQKQSTSEKTPRSLKRESKKVILNNGNHLACSPQVLVLNNSYSGLPTSESIVFSHDLSDQIVTVTTQSMEPNVTAADNLSLSNTMLNSDGLQEDTLQVKSNEIVVLSETPMYQHEEPSGDIVYATDILDHEEVTCANYDTAEVTDYSANMSHCNYTTQAESVVGSEDFHESMISGTDQYASASGKIELSGYSAQGNESPGCLSERAVKIGTDTSQEMKDLHGNEEFTCSISYQNHSSTINGTSDSQQEGKLLVDSSISKKVMQVVPYL